MFSIDRAWDTIRSQEVLAIIVILFVVLFIYWQCLRLSPNFFLNLFFLPELWISEDAPEMS